MEKINTDTNDKPENLRLQFIHKPCHSFFKKSNVFKGPFIWVQLPGWLGYRDKFCCLFIWEISARSRSETNMVELVSFAIVVALWTPVALLICLMCLLLKWKYTHDKTYAIFAAMLRKRRDPRYWDRAVRVVSVIKLLVLMNKPLWAFPAVQTLL